MKPELKTHYDGPSLKSYLESKGFTRKMFNSLVNPDSRLNNGELTTLFVRDMLVDREENYYTKEEINLLEFLQNEFGDEIVIHYWW